MKHLLLLVFWFFALPCIYGQEKTYSLKECVETGLRNNLSLKEQPDFCTEKPNGFNPKPLAAAPRTVCRFPNGGLPDEACQCNHRCIAGKRFPR